MGLGVSNAFSGFFKREDGKSNTNENAKLWSDKVQKAVEDKFLTGLADIDYNQSLDLADAIAQKAKDFNIDVEPIVNEARRQEQMQTGQKYQSLARQAGSDANSLVAAAFNEALINQESNLASLTAELEAMNQQGGLDALSQALDAGNATADTILNLGNLLKGAQTQTHSHTNTRNTSWGFQNTTNAGFGAGQ